MSILQPQRATMMYLFGETNRAPKISVCKHIEKCAKSFLDHIHISTLILLTKFLKCQKFKIDACSGPELQGYTLL